MRISGILCAAFLLLLTGCSFAPHYQRPEQDIPPEWRKIDLGSTPLETDWWKRFDDPVLASLIKNALTYNQDLAESLARIDSAAAQVGVATAALFPRLDGSAAATAQGASEKTPNTVPFSTSGLSRSTTQYQGGLNASWELDLWGKFRNRRTYLSDVLMNTVCEEYQTCRLYRKSLQQRP